MNQAASIKNAPDWHKIQQIVKWSVYVLLIVNFSLYVVEDATRASFTLHAGSTFLDWTSAFATSIDVSAWFVLLAMLEIETYVLEDEDLTGWVATTLHSIRLFCVVLLAHSIYAFLMTVVSLAPTRAVENVQDLCDMTAADVSYVYNLEYTTVSEQTCGQLAADTRFYWVGDDPVVANMAGLTLERHLAWADLAEVVLWVLVIGAIEIVVRLQGRGVTSGRVITIANSSKGLFYAALIGLGVYWATLSHWLYLWDELLWIGGFAAIEMNINDWREEILDRQAIT